MSLPPPGKFTLAGCFVLAVLPESLLMRNKKDRFMNEAVLKIGKISI